MLDSSLLQLVNIHVELSGQQPVEPVPGPVAGLNTEQTLALNNGRHG